ncbi:D-ribose pyranase [Vibrio sp. TH_r3]|uniref:D-ribose pyranase n=1 Tax=Vibrio sp. TH_r3 TaxID=3082084 RepID=UPI00295297AC|nr:D-ribose pyranase [Vibrio sp. TH_r3]MDV7103757.1 D-ribose pyranase [Vibrio sp. TH_r3]
MKKTRLLNSQLSYLVATLGHTDEITIADAGLPVPDGVERIDLALTQGMPSFLHTVEVLLSESQIEGVVIAEETKHNNPLVHEQLLILLEKDSELTGKKISVSYVSHETFKERSFGSKAVVRTGECTPYANVIFQTGVTF